MAFTKASFSGTVGVGGGGTANQSNPAGGIGTVRGWHPTVLYMLGLIVAEILIVGFLTRHLFGGGE